MESVKDVTGIIVTFNSTQFLFECFESIRGCHSDLRLIIIDGSSVTDECFYYAMSLNSDPFTDVISCRYNIGHGRGLDLGVSLVTTKYFLTIDSDTVMMESPIESMVKLFDKDTYGVGYLEKTGFDGYEYGVKPNHRNTSGMLMLHPYFSLIDRDKYYQHIGFVHHGAPAYKIALDLFKSQSGHKFKEFPGLGHTSGKGWAWEGAPRRYIKHDTAGTRKIRKSQGLKEIELGWEL